MSRFFSFILKKFNPPKTQSMSMRHMPIMRLSKREAFFHGFFRVFGLTRFAVESPNRSDMEALQDDFFAISEDSARVFCRETTVDKESAELVYQDEQE